MPGEMVTTETARRRFALLVLPHLDDAYTLARWLTGQGADAEDVVQEACLRALRALESTEVAQPRAWLLSIVRNTAFTWIAKNRPKAMIVARDEEDDLHGNEVADSAPLPDEALIARADRSKVRDAIAGLPDVFREAIVMREINGLSYREIAESCGVPIGTVMSRLARARTLLMQALAGTA